ncbi:plant virulence effector HPE1-like domain-containing protein [Pararhizobium sp. DWP3-4]|uniref:plant virulence effector HPE1-like domain-containing protein n=1 Tax=Pararhizobium sp. DWP3-4 TaxID=2804565 RepID=UPI003CF08DB1
MRALLFTFASLAAASTAGASSLENVISGEKVNSSISQLSCGQCPPLVVKKKTGYIVPDVAPGTERVELKTINGEMKLVRTEAWLGGSPVVFISKASDEDIRQAQANSAPSFDLAKAATGDAPPVEAEAKATVEIVDMAAKTSSLDLASMAGPAAVTPQDSRSQEVDLKNFQLRLN